MSQSEAQLLQTVLEDLQRHLHWQVQQLGPELLLDTQHLKEVRALARQARAGAGTGAGGAAPALVASGGGGLGALRERLRERASGGARQAGGASSGASVQGTPAATNPGSGAPAFSAPAAAPVLAGTHASGASAAPTSATPVSAPPSHASHAPAASGTQAASAVQAPGVERGPETAGTLTELRTALLGCQRCRLCESRTQVVFGTGNPNAELVFVGEAPGAEEDRQGQPFVGESGRLLTKMIEAMGYSRDQVYICNVIKCRPPNNRNPGPDELAQCEPFLRQQLSLLQPKAMVALGKFAAQALLRETTPISSLRGIWREYDGIPLMPTYHPAYLLRQPNEKRKVWSDLQDVMRRLGKTPR